MSFYKKLNRSWKRSGSLLCVGLDPDLTKIPPHLRPAGTSPAETIFAFNRAVVDATADLVCAYKPQIAHYAAAGAETALERTLAHLRENHPDIPLILDAKRGDIGSTAEHYAREAFDRYGADAVTVNPYLGGDTLEPFLERADRGVIVLCRTSNPGSGDFQNLDVGGRPLYLAVAEKAAREWNRNRNVALVVGATYPEELGAVRDLVGGEMPLLVPGVGAQGGDLEGVLRHGLNPGGTGLVINSSRGILYAGGGEDFADAARAAATELRDAINRGREGRRAG